MISHTPLCLQTPHFLDVYDEIQFMIGSGEGRREIDLDNYFTPATIEGGKFVLFFTGYQMW